MPMFKHVNDGTVVTTDELSRMIGNAAFRNPKVIVYHAGLATEIPEFIEAPTNDTIHCDVGRWVRLKDTELWRFERTGTRLPPRKLSS